MDTCSCGSGLEAKDCCGVDTFSLADNDDVVAVVGDEGDDEEDEDDEDGDDEEEEEEPSEESTISW